MECLLFLLLPLWTVRYHKVFIQEGCLGGRIYSVCHSFYIFSGHVITAMVVEKDRIENFTGSRNLTPWPWSTEIFTNNCILHWKISIAVTIGAIASLLSYASFTGLILMPVNGILCCSKCECLRYVFCSARCTSLMKAFKNSAFSPYNDSDESSNLSAAETLCFYINYLTVYVLLICSFAFTLVYANFVNCWDSLHITRVVFYLSSQFCAIQSCFIFSKIISKVTNKLKQLATDMDQVNFTEQNPQNVEIENDTELKGLVQSNDEKKVGRGRYYWLQKMDQDFIRQVKPTLDLFGIWFFIHCLFFGLTTVLLSAFFLQIMISVLKYSIKSNDLLPVAEVKIKALYIMYLFFFTLVHAYLIFYPCIRAASIATTRKKMIHTISKKRWTNIPLSIQSKFVQYLTSVNFSFQVPMFDVAININWGVYMTVFFAMFSVVLTNI